MGTHSLDRSELLRKIALIGAAFGGGSKDHGAEEGPHYLKREGICEQLKEKGLHVYWHKIVENSLEFPKITQSTNSDVLWDWIKEYNQRLAQAIQEALQAGCFPVILGGDHSIAVGTWGALTRFYGIEGQFGLLWLDAHMDAHTPETSISRDIHGMPVAALLGQGNERYVKAVVALNPLNPKFLVHIGVRSYEEGEANFLKKLNTRIITMSEYKNLVENKFLRRVVRLLL